MELLESSEARVREYLDAHEHDVLEFARELIRTPSPNPPGDERAMADVVVERLRTLGLTTITRVGASEARPNLIVDVDGGRPGRTVILAGHLDTKPAGDLSAWNTDPWDPVLSGGELIGLGSGDMKVAVAAMTYAAAALADAGFAGKVALVFTADEEAGSALGSRWLAEQGLIRADAAIIGEPGGIEREWEAIHLVSRGVALFRIKVRGTQMHSSISDRLPGVNATVEMAKLIVAMQSDLRGYLRYEPHPLCPTGPTVNVGVTAQAGVFFGVYPGNAEFGCDIRTLPGMSEESLREDIQRFLDDARAADPELDAELDWVTMMPACEITPDHPVVTALQSAVIDVFGAPARLDAFPGATDAPYFQLAAGVPTIASFGPGLLPRAHSPNESLAADGAALAAHVYALAALRFCSERDDPSI